MKKNLLKFVIPLITFLALMAYAVVPLVDVLTLKWFNRDLNLRGDLITNSIQGRLIEQLDNGRPSQINKFFDQLIQDERLFAIVLCSEQMNIINKSQTFPGSFSCTKLIEHFDNGKNQIIRPKQGPLHISVHSIIDEGEKYGQLILLHDMSFIERRSSDTKEYVFYFFIIIGFIVSLITVVIAYIGQKGLINSVRSLIKGEIDLFPISKIQNPELVPIAKDIRSLIKDLERERKEKDESQIHWNPKALKNILKEDLAGDEVLIVSNREPYIHVKKNDTIEIQFPASGLVTALEPIMRACSGTWIAHGSGNADREVVDGKDHVQVPPLHPSYQIRRVWLSPEEEEGYYYGFSNEGLWPLCHIAHTRPIFRTKDWNNYVDVNKKFAEAVVEEAKTDNPVILVQDYHLALVPKMIKEKLPDATIITFWHIPWPNPESFGICPWRKEILEGLLGSSILGFHTRFHCNNFFETVDRFLETRVDRETSTISYNNKLTAVKNYPISIEWPSKWQKNSPPINDCQRLIREINKIPENCVVALGVDRLDYTKGIIERILAVERLFEIYPEWIGKLVFIQIAAPTRTRIVHYQNFEFEVMRVADRVNQKYADASVKPISLLIEHHSPEKVYQYYRGSNICMVTSLHDGMNLVAKEFVSSRDDEKGVLILSQFTGASRELPEALIINPYNIDQCALALHMALTMPVKEQQERMRSMRGLIQEHNVYRWAGRMLIDAAALRRRQRLLGKLSNQDNLFLEGRY